MLFKLNLQSKDNLFQFSPKLDNNIRDILISELSKLNLEGHVFILSSGTTSKGGVKGYALSKKALIESALAVNEHLSLGSDDAWFLSLPPWHIGGLSVYIRAQVAGAKVITSNESWNVQSWVKLVEEASVTSIVPLQAYDIVKEGIHPPKTLKYLIVGGDHLAGSLHEKLIALGWPVIRTFGMTEVCSQLATEICPSTAPKLQVLNNHKVKTNEDGVLLVKSKSLFSGMFSYNNEFTYSKPILEDGFFKTNDLVELNEGQLNPKSRVDQAFKCKGRLFYLNDVRELLDNFAYENGIYSKLAVQVVISPREGHVLRVLADKQLQKKKDFLSAELKQLFAPAVLKEVEFVDGIARTELGKVKRS